MLLFHVCKCLLIFRLLFDGRNSLWTLGLVQSNLRHTHSLKLLQEVDLAVASLIRVMLLKVQDRQYGDPQLHPAFAL